MFRMQPGVRMSREAKVPVLVERGIKSVAPPHLRALANVEQIIIMNCLVHVDPRQIIRRQVDCHKSGFNWIMLGKGSHLRAGDSRKNIEPKRHLLADVPINWIAYPEMQNNFMTQRANFTYL